MLWGALAATGLAVGAYLAHWAAQKQVAVGTIAGFGAGMLIGAAGLGLLHDAGNQASLPLIVGALLGGATLFTLADGLLVRCLQNPDGGRAVRAASSLFAGIMMDGLPESLAIGLQTFDGSVPVQLLAAVFLSNLPEGIVGTTALRQAGYDTKFAWTAWGSIIAVMIVLAGGGYWLGHHLQPAGEGTLQAMAAGGILAMVATSLIPTAARLSRRLTGLATVFGVTAAYVLTRWAG